MVDDGKKIWLKVSMDKQRDCVGTLEQGGGAADALDISRL